MCGVARPKVTCRARGGSPHDARQLCAAGLRTRKALVDYYQVYHLSWCELLYRNVLV